VSKHQLENEFYDGIVRGANADGWPLMRTESSPGMIIPFDIMGCSPDGLAVGMECKMDPTVSLANPVKWRDFHIRQHGWLQRYARHGAIALVGICTPGRTVTVVRYQTLLDFDRPIYHLRHVVLTYHSRKGKEPEMWVGWNQLLINSR
jgi:hypothetical protein